MVTIKTQQSLVAQSSAQDDFLNAPMIHCGAFYLDLSRKPRLMSYLFALKRLNILLPIEVHGKILSDCPEIIPSLCIRKLFSDEEGDRIWKFHHDEVVELYKECRKWPQ
jgi:hypothetical protein